MQKAAVDGVRGWVVQPRHDVPVKQDRDAFAHRRIRTADALIAVDHSRQRTAGVGTATQRRHFTRRRPWASIRKLERFDEIMGSRGP